MAAQEAVDLEAPRSTRQEGSAMSGLRMHRERGGDGEQVPGEALGAILGRPIERERFRSHGALLISSRASDHGRDLAC
jgi:hypothetical protein